MKSVIFSIVCLIALSVKGQSNSFLISDGKLVWENVFISNETNIPALISRHVRLEIIEEKDKTLYKGKGTNIKSACPDTSAFIKNDLCFDFEIEVIDGKYRVTLFNLVFKDAGKSTPAETYFIKNNEIQVVATLQNDLSCLEGYFNKIFNPALYKNRS